MDGKQSICVRKDKVNRLLNCAVCQKRSEDPRLLPCSHTFCRKCLDHLIIPDTDPENENNVLECRICEGVFQVPPEGTRGFPKNFYMSSIPTGESDASKCSKHPGVIKEFYCETCKLQVCARCCLGEHVNHTFLDSSEIADGVRQRMSDDATKYTRVLRRVVSKLKTTAEEIKAPSEEAIKLILKSSSCINTMLSEYERDLVEIIRRSRNHCLESVRECIKSFEEEIETANDILQLGDQSLTPYEMMERSKSLEVGLRHLRSSHLPVLTFQSSLETSALPKESLKTKLGTVVLTSCVEMESVPKYLSTGVKGFKVTLNDAITALVVGDEHIYVVHSHSSCMYVYNRAGILQAACTLSNLKDPSGMVLIKKEKHEVRLVISCFQGQNLHFVSLSDGFVVTEQEVVDIEFSPCHVSVNRKTNELVVADNINKRLVVYDMTGIELRKVDIPPNIITAPVCGVMTSQGTYAVLDHSGVGKLIWLNPNGAVIRTHRADSTDDLSGPCHLVETPSGDLLVADTLNNRVLVFDSNMEPVVHPLSFEDISVPGALCFDEANDQLIIGHGDNPRLISVYNYIEQDIGLKKGLSVQVNSFRVRGPVFW